MSGNCPSCYNRARTNLSMRNTFFSTVWNVIPISDTLIKNCTIGGLIALNYVYQTRVKMLNKIVHDIDPKINRKFTIRYLFGKEVIPSIFASGCNM